MVETPAAKTVAIVKVLDVEESKGREEVISGLELLEIGA